MPPSAPEQRTIDVDVRDVAAEGRTLRGYAAVYDAESDDLGGFTERIAAGAFADVLRTEPDVRALLNHDPSQVLGRTRSGTLRLTDDARGLGFELDLPASPLGDNVREAVRRGDIDGASFRFVVGRESWEGSQRTIETVEQLHDCSVATFGAYPAASVELRARRDHDPSDSAHSREDDMPDEPTTPGGSEASNSTTAGSGGASTTAGLTVEQRTGTSTPTIDARVRTAIAGVRRGEVRSLTEASNSAGPITPPELSTFLWDRVRPASVALASGMQVVSTTRSEVKWPAVASDAAPDWYDELDTITASDPGFTTLTATPRKLAVRTEVSNEVWDDSEPAALDVLTSNLTSSLGVKLDLAIYEGNATANPKSINGLKFTTGIQSVSMGANGASLTNLDPIADAIALLEAESIPGPYVAVMPPRSFAVLRKLKEATGSIKPLLADPPSLDAPRSALGVPIYSTAQLSVTETQGSSNDASSVYVYSVATNIGPVVVNRYNATDGGTIEIDRSRLFDVDGSEVRGKLRVDLLVPRPKAVVRIVGVRP